MVFKNDPDLSVVAEVANADANLTTDESKTNEVDDDMKILEKEDQKTVGYQETLKIYVKNINKSITTIWRPLYEVIDGIFFEKLTFFHNTFRLM